MSRKYCIVPDYVPLYAMNRCWGKLHGPLDKPTPIPVDIIGQLLMQKGSEKVNIFEVIPGTDLPPVQLTLENYKLPYEEIANLPKEESPAGSITVTPVQESETVNPTVTVVLEAGEPAPVDTETPKEESEEQVVETEDTADESKMADETHEEQPSELAITQEEYNELTKKYPQEEKEPHPESEIDRMVAESSTSTELEFSQKQAELMDKLPTDLPVATSGYAQVGESDTEATADTTVTATASSDVNPYAGLTKAERKRLRREEAAKKAAEEATKAEAPVEE